MKKIIDFVKTEFGLACLSFFLGVLFWGFMSTLTEHKENMWPFWSFGVIIFIFCNGCYALASEE